MTVQPATQTCGECRIEPSLACYNFGLHQVHDAGCWKIVPCPLHAQAEALLEALEAVLNEYDPTWEDWTETDDRLLAETGTGKARRAIRAIAAAKGGAG